MIDELVLCGLRAERLELSESIDEVSREEVRRVPFPFIMARMDRW